MKQLRTLALLAVCAFALSAVAQQTPPADTHEGHEHGQGQGQGMGHGQGMDHKMPTVDEMVQTMSERLSLTDDQKVKVRKIAEDTHKKMDEMHLDQSTSREDRMAKMRTAHDEAMTKVRAILNDDQKKKLDEWQKEMHEHKGMHDHEGMHGKKTDSKEPQKDDRVQK
jgi:Spy/CpxP family protein refolding chaperone